MIYVTACVVAPLAWASSMPSSIFTGGCDWYIVEKDAGAADDEPEDFQSQAYGLAIIHEAEMGYISIPEILSVGAELDLHWTPRSIESIAMGAKA